MESLNKAAQLPKVSTQEATIILLQMAKLYQRDAFAHLGPEPFFALKVYTDLYKGPLLNHSPGRGSAN